MTKATHPTPRLVLRPPAAADAEALAAELNDWDVARRLAAVPHPYAIDDARAWLAAQAKDDNDDIVFLLALSADMASAIGCVGFHGFGDANEPKIGYWLAKRFWGQGLMTEAVRTAIARVQAERGVRVIHSGYLTDNAASAAIQRKLGFIESGRSRMHCLAQGRELDQIETCLHLDDASG